MSWSWQEMIFPRACEGCQKPMTAEPGYLCWDCQIQVRMIHVPYCECCGDPIPGEVGGPFVCTSCHQSPPAFDWARSAVRYDGLARRCLCRFKYQQGLWLLDLLTNWLVALWRTCPPDCAETDWITAVPLYPRRERERGFNQAALLAANLAAQVGRPFLPRALRRRRPTPTQTRLTASQRLHNVQGAFSVASPRRVREARIVLVDDVMTTGATVNECARALKAAGAAAVRVLTVGRG